MKVDFTQNAALTGNTVYVGTEPPTGAERFARMAPATFALLTFMGGDRFDVAYITPQLATDPDFMACLSSIAAVIVIKEGIT